MLNSYKNFIYSCYFSFENRSKVYALLGISSNRGDLDVFSSIKKDSLFNELTQNVKFKELNQKAIKIHYYDKKAYQAMNDKKYTLAIEYFDALNTLSNSRVAKYLNSTGLSYYYLEEYGKALDYYEEAVVVDPKLKEGFYYNNIGTAYIYLNELEKASSAFQKYEQLFPYAGRSYRNWAMFHAASGDVDKALQNLVKAIDFKYNNLDWLETDVRFNNVKPDAIKIKEYYKLGYEAFQNKDYATAITYLDSFNTISNSVGGNSLLYTGLSYYYLKEYDRALEHYEKAVVENPNIKEEYCYNYYNLTGMVYIHLDDLEKAFSAFQQYNKLFPYDGRTNRNWAMYHAAKENKSEALSNLEKAVDRLYQGLDFLKMDTSLDILREDDRFIEIIKRIEKRLEPNDKSSVRFVISSCP